MAASKRKPIPISLYLATDPITGEDWLVESESYFREARALAVTELDRTIASIQRNAAMPGQDEAPTDEEIENWRKAREADVDALLEERRSLHAEARKTAERTDFILLKPTFGSYKQARSAATILNEESGEREFSQSEYEYQLLIDEGVQGLSIQDIHDLPTCVANRLGAQLASMIAPNEKRLPFALSQSTTPSQAG